MRLRSSLAVVAALLLVVAALPLAQSKPSGAATPQEAVAVLNKATAANDALQALPVISPTGLKQIANEGLTGLLMVLSFSDPDDPMPGGAKPSKAELDAKRKQYKQAVDLATQVVKPYGLDTLIGKPALAPESQKTLDAALAKTVSSRQRHDGGAVDQDAGRTGTARDRRRCVGADERDRRQGHQHRRQV